MQVLSLPLLTSSQSRFNSAPHFCHRFSNNRHHHPTACGEAPFLPLTRDVNKMFSLSSVSLAGDFHIRPKTKVSGADCSWLATIIKIQTAKMNTSIIVHCSAVQGNCGSWQTLATLDTSIKGPELCKTHFTSYSPEVRIIQQCFNTPFWKLAFCDVTGGTDT